MSNVVSKGLNIPDKLDAEMTKIVFDCLDKGVRKRKGIVVEKDDVMKLLNEHLPEPPIGVGKMEYLFLTAVANLSGKLTEEQYFQLYLDIQITGQKGNCQAFFILTKKALKDITL